MASSSAASIIIPGGAQCKVCRCDFPPDVIKNKACPRCSKNLAKYGNPRACEHCNVVAAFIGLKCQKCSNSIKKYGSPIRCCKCKLKCAFNRPGHDKQRALCLMCMFARQRAKAGQNPSSADEHPDATEAKNNSKELGLDKLDAKNTSTPNSKPIPYGTPGSNGRDFRVQPKGYFLQTNMLQDIDYNEEGKTSLIGGWAKHRNSTMDGPSLPPTPKHLVSNIGRGTPTRLKNRMSAGDQLVMVLNLQAEIAKLNSTLSRKENELMEKEEYWDRKLVEEKVEIEKSVQELDLFQQEEEKRMRELIKNQTEKYETAKSEICELKEKAREKEKEKEKARKKNVSDAESEKEDGHEKDPDDIKRYGDGSDQEDMDVDEDNRATDKSDEERKDNDSDVKTDDESDNEKENRTKVAKRKASQIDSDDEDPKNSEMNGEEADSNINENKKSKRKGAMIFSDSEDDDQEETKPEDDVNSDREDISDKAELDKNPDSETQKNKSKGNMIFSDSEDDEDQKETKSDQVQVEKEITSANNDSDKNNSDSEKENPNDKENISLDKEESNPALDKDTNDGNQSDKENSDNDESDKEHSDKENSDKENAAKENSDKENSDKENSDKENSDKENSDKDDSDKEDSDEDLIPKKKTSNKNGADIFSDSDSEGSND
ncbi:unnamed protein product [Meganyctiphanes norvegica]|uniref:Uncharacterized protein n=1 Tax=Meganyctiphanes norvegica TaxID=48144 RepID=A0AAV2Q4P1_MEGNR